MRVVSVIVASLLCQAALAGKPKLVRNRGNTRGVELKNFPGSRLHTLSAGWATRHEAHWVAWKPGTASPPHYHPETEAMDLILDGEGEVQMNDRVFTIKPGDVVGVPVGVVHSVRSIGSVGLRYLNLNTDPGRWDMVLTGARQAPNVLREPLPPNAGDLTRRLAITRGALAAGETTKTFRFQKAETTYYILEGSGTIHIGPRTARVKVGDAVSVPPGAMHSLRSGKAPLRYVAATSDRSDPKMEL